MVRVLRAALPLLRQQGSGHILGVSSGLGIVSMPLIGFYCATKWAIEALHESLAHEVKDFGIKVTLIEPGAYATDFGKSAKRADGMEAYGPLRQRIFERLASMERGNPQATADAVLKMVDAEEPPLRNDSRQQEPSRATCCLCRPSDHLGGLGSGLERSASRPAG